jgi:lysozyme
MKYSSVCIDHVKRSEDEPGFLSGRCTRLKAYKCPAGIWTCGWGTTRGVGPKTEFTQEQADARLMEDLDSAAEIVDAWVTIPLTQGQYDALVAFVQNVGPGEPDEKDGFVWLKKRGPNGLPVHSTLLRKLLARDYPGAAREFLKWVHGGGKKLGGLAIRRQREKEMFEA